MSREPDWWQYGYDQANGKRKSAMVLPEDFFESQAEKVKKNDFNLLKYSYDYTIDWLETEQWKKEVGEKIRKFVKKYKTENKRVDEFMQRAFGWVNGYSYWLTQGFLLQWLWISHDEKCKLSDDALDRLASHAQIQMRCWGCDREIDLKTDTYYVYNPYLSYLSSTGGIAGSYQNRYYHVPCLKKLLRRAAKATCKMGWDGKTISNIVEDDLKNHTLHRGEKL